MIITVTANPSQDRAVALAGPLDVGAVQRADSDRVDAGGKGVNVSRALAAAGVASVAVFPAASDDPFRALVEATGIPAQPVTTVGAVRSNLTLADPDGRTTKINLPGMNLSTAEAADLQEQIVALCDGASWLVLAGSLPRGLDDGFYADVALTVRARYGDAAPRIAIDTSGAPLREAVERAHPDLIKPNGEELAELLGEQIEDDPDDPEAAAARALRIVPSAAAAALVTLGSRGALLVEGDRVLFGAAPKITVRSTVGAGDSSLAGFLIAADAGATAADRLARAIAYGAAAASLPGTQPPAPEDANPSTLTITDWTDRFART